MARRAAEELFLLRELRAYVRSFSFGICRQRTQLSTSLLSAYRCLAYHAARHELMVVYRQKCAKVVRHSRKSRRMCLGCCRCCSPQEPTCLVCCCLRGRVRSPSRPAGSRVVPCRCCCRWSWCVRLSAPPCAPLSRSSLVCPRKRLLFLIIFLLFLSREKSIDGIQFLLISQREKRSAQSARPAQDTAPVSTHKQLLAEQAGCLPQPAPPNS